MDKANEKRRIILADFFCVPRAVLVEHKGDDYTYTNKEPLPACKWRKAGRVAKAIKGAV